MAKEPLKMVKVVYSVLCREGDEGSVRSALENAMKDNFDVAAVGNRCVEVEPSAEEIAEYQDTLEAIAGDVDAIFEED